MEENKKINTQIVIMVVIVIILILSLLGILLYVVNENKKMVSNNNTTTTNTTTTTIPVLEDEEIIANEVIEEYLTLLKEQNKISDFQYEVSLLSEEDYCSGMEYFPNKIYANVNITYKKIDKTFVITENDNNTNTDSEDVFETSATYIISMVDGKYQIEDFYITC